MVVPATAATATIAPATATSALWMVVWFMSLLASGGDGMLGIPPIVRLNERQDLKGEATRAPVGVFDRGQGLLGGGAGLQVAEDGGEVDLLKRGGRGLQPHSQGR